MPLAPNAEIAADTRGMEYLAKTMWAESRGESDEGQSAVAWVIFTRSHMKGRVGPVVVGKAGALEKVCLQPWQFSCWNKNDPNYPKLLALQPEQYAKQMSIAKGVVNGTIPDPTGGADHYHTTSILPDWASSMKTTVTIGNHIFYDSRQRP